MAGGGTTSVYEQHISDVGKKFVKESIADLFPEAWPKEVAKVLGKEGIGNDEEAIVMALFKLGILDTEWAYEKGYRIRPGHEVELKQMSAGNLATLVEQSAYKIHDASTAKEHKVFLEAARRLHREGLREAALLNQSNCGSKKNE